MRVVKTVLQIEPGKGQYREFPVQSVNAYMVETAMDTDADAFSIDIPDTHAAYGYLLNRDVEIRVNLFTGLGNTSVQQLQAGIVDDAQFDTDDGVLSLVGRDFSCVATDTDAVPGRWKHVKPHKFITERAQSLGISDVAITPMSEISLVYADGSESEWTLWYRLCRERNMFLWFEPTGRLVGDFLNYSLNPTYQFGHAPRGQDSRLWLEVERIVIRKTTRSRTAEVWVYAEDGKSKKPVLGQARDIFIDDWRRRPLKIQTSSKSKTQAEANKIADEEVIEGIVGALEITVTIRDPGFVVHQNYMAYLNLPELDFVGMFYIVGVTLRGGPDGYFQDIRLREKGFALSKLVPEGPTLSPTLKRDPADTRSPADIAAGLKPGSAIWHIRWLQAFVNAAREFTNQPYVAWDFATFLGVLLAICDKETGFKNVRHPTGGPEWYSQQAATGTGFGVATADPDHPKDVIRDAHVGGGVELWKKRFANSANDSLTAGIDGIAQPHEIAVGPMQLVTPTYKSWADEYGWNDTPKHDELSGGRWNPASNIRAAARALQEKLTGVDPGTLINIKIGIKRYYGSASDKANQAYADDVWNRYLTKFKDLIAASITAAPSFPSGSANRNIPMPDGHNLQDALRYAPDAVVKAIDYAMRMRGTPYSWGGGSAEGPTLGSGPGASTVGFDCSGFIWACYAHGGIDISKLEGRRPTSQSMFADANFAKVNKDQLLPGDLVFFEGANPDHIGMYLDNHQFIAAPHTGDVVKISSLGDSFYVANYTGARRVVNWQQATGTPSAPTPKGKKRVMIQAGHASDVHDPSTASSPVEPYGHTGEVGASGEFKFTMEIRDKVLAWMAQDPRLIEVKGDAWSASAGPTSDPSDDIDFKGDMFVSIHYDAGSAGSGFFFGYTRGATDSRPTEVSANSAKLADKIAAEIEKISGHPTRLADNDHFGGSPTNATGWGYYAWGSSLRAAPDDVDHIKGVPARLIMENGRADDTDYLTNKRDQIARAIYIGICNYYGFTPVG